MRKHVLIFCLVMAGILILCGAGFSPAFSADEGKAEAVTPESINGLFEFVSENYYGKADREDLFRNFIRGISQCTKTMGRGEPLGYLEKDSDTAGAVRNLPCVLNANGITGESALKCLRSGLKAMAESMGNVGCEYYLPEKYTMTLEEMGYNKGGCGFITDKKTVDDKGRWAVVEVLQDFPAEQQGLKAGDLLLSVNGKSLLHKSLKELGDMVRGPVGSKVTLTIFRPSDNREMDISITRTWLGPNPKSIRHAVISRPSGRIGYIKFNYMGSRMESHLEDIYREFGDEKVDKVVWDLRNCTGVTAGALELAGKFVSPARLFVSQVMRNDREEFLGTGQAKAGWLPKAVLINVYSEAPALLLALTLRKQAGVPLVGPTVKWEGDKTESFQMSDGSHFSVPVAYYEFADGFMLKNGAEIRPDHEVKQSPFIFRGREDKQLEKAEEIR